MLISRYISFVVKYKSSKRRSTEHPVASLLSTARCNFYARVYATEIHGLCWRAAAATVHATNRPTNAPAQKRCEKERERERERERETCACVSAQEGKNATGRKIENHGRNWERERGNECNREFAVSADSCVFRVPNARNKRCLSAATWVMIALCPPCLLACSPACLLPACLPTCFTS